MRKIVVAPSYKWFSDYCQEHGIDPRDKHSATYVCAAGQLLGMSPLACEVVKLGCWWYGKPERFRMEVWRLEERIKLLSNRP
jgi:hypothetical protein